MIIPKPRIQKNKEDLHALGAVVSHIIEWQSLLNIIPQVIMECPYVCIAYYVVEDVYYNFPKCGGDIGRETSSSGKERTPLFLPGPHSYH